MSHLDYATASQLYSTEFMQEYQSAERLGGTIQERHDTNGEALNLPVIDKIEMNGASFAPTNVPISQFNKRNVVVEQNNFMLKTVVGYGEKTLFNYDLVKAHATEHAAATARFKDYVRIQAALNDADYPVGSFTTQVAVGVGPYTGMNQEKLSSALSGLQAQGVDTRDGMCSMWLPAVGLTGFLKDDRVVSFFYNNSKPLANNNFPEYLGVSIRTLADQAAGVNYLPFTEDAGTRTYNVPIIQQSAMVMAYNVDPVSEIVWNPLERRYEIVSQMVCGAKIVKEKGIAIVKVETPAVAN